MNFMRKCMKKMHFLFLFLCLYINIENIYALLEKGLVNFFVENVHENSSQCCRREIVSVYLRGKE